MYGSFLGSSFGVAIDWTVHEAMVSEISMTKIKRSMFSRVKANGIISKAVNRTFAEESLGTAEAVASREKCNTQFIEN